MGPKQYITKPVTVEAMRFDGSHKSALRIIRWIVEEGGKNVLSFGYQEHNTYRSWHGNGVADFQIDIEVREGRLTAEPGDYIVKDAKGEFYVVNLDTFEQTYEEEGQK
ncbi:hypothetical protein ACIP5Z_02205 [Rothia terrae]|uniref:hypothetical protein n=1 Tax=Rothia terrae TaxID=396015 RepID=UPI00380E0EB0